VPAISRFLGIVISMYHSEHNPPHFHAKYGSQKASFSIMELKLIHGQLPKRVVSLVLEWAHEHREELMRDWLLAASRRPLQKIAPLV
jgi:hypothetical protein